MAARHPEPSKKPFEPPHLTVYGSIGQLTRTNCPAHGVENEPGLTVYQDNHDPYGPCARQYGGGGLGRKKT